MMNAIRYAAVSWLALTMACTGSVGDTPGQQGGTAAGPGSGSSGNGNGNGSGAGAGQGVSGNGPDGTPGAGAGNGTAGAAATPAGEIGLHGMPIHTRFVRLTHDQWELSVRDLLKLDAVPGVSSSFASDPPDGTFSNNERALFVTSTLRNDYQRAAETLSEQVARNATALARVTGGSMDSAAFIRSFGRRAYRRPLTTVEEQRYQALFTSGATVFKSGNAFADGAQLFIEAVLQSPHFLFRSELGADGAPLSGY
jgi:hypothetical protein